MPPNQCAACINKLSNINKVDTKLNREFLVLHGDMIECEEHELHKCFIYNAKTLEKGGLLYSYPIIFEFKDSILLEYNPII